MLWHPHRDLKLLALPSPPSSKHTNTLRDDFKGQWRLTSISRQMLLAQGTHITRSCWRRRTTQLRGFWKHAGDQNSTQLRGTKNISGEAELSKWLGQAILKIFPTIDYFCQDQPVQDMNILSPLESLDTRAELCIVDWMACVWAWGPNL